FFLDDSGRENHAVAVVVQLEREDQDVPVPAVSLGRQVGQAAEAAIDGSFAGIGYSPNYVPPFAAQLRKLFKQVFTGEPVALLLVEPGKVLIYIKPVAIAIQDLHNYVFAHGHGDA